MKKWKKRRDIRLDGSRIIPILGIIQKNTKNIKPLLEKTSVGPSKEVASLSPSVDLRRWCSDIENQKNLGSCTANAGVGVIEYYERRAFGTHIDASRLFLYKTTRNLLHLKGDT